jgi:hypothetical protein
MNPSPLMQSPTFRTALPVASMPAAPQGNGIRGKISSLVSATPYPLMILVAVVLLVAVIVYIVLRLQRGAYKSVSLLKSSIIKANVGGSSHVSTSAALIPSSTNGNEFTVSMWLFVENVTLTNNHKVVMYRGNPTTYNNGKMFVYMDAKTNTLYSSIRTSAVQEETMVSREPSLEEIRTNNRFLQSSIDYIPLQRWVHVMYSVKDTTLSTFLDGDLYSVTSVYELPSTATGARPIPVKQEGDMLIGGRVGRDGYSGYIGNAQYFNFAISLQDAKLVYKKGPYRGSWLQFIGMGNLGFRSPVYRVGTEDKDMVK